MAPDPISPGQLQKAASSEPSTTRPNPFDDDDRSSRKRQRTSVSGSPIQPAAADANADAVNTLHDSLSCVTSGADDPRAQIAPKADTNLVPSARPQTPERAPTANHPNETPSNKVTTINLRSAQKASDPFSKSRFAQNQQLHSIISDADIKESVEDADVDLVSVPLQDMSTPKSSSSMSPSPPVEVISIKDDGEDEVDVGDIDFDSYDHEISMVGNGQAFPDPTHHFPYNDPEESLSETVQRLSQYLSTQSTLDDTVLTRVQEWLQLYLNFAKTASPQSLLLSCKENRSFWLILPDLIISLASRKPNILINPAHREIATAIYALFGRLAAVFVRLDCYILQQSQQLSSATERRLPELFSLGFLHQFQLVTRREDFFQELEFESSLLASGHESDDASILLGVLLRSPGGDCDLLKRFANALVEQVTALPRLCEGLSPVCQMLANILREYLRAYRSGHRSASRAALQLQTCHELWERISSSLDIAVEKHVTHLTPDGTLNLIRALTDMLRICLHGDHELAVSAVDKHQQEYPELQRGIVPEAIAWTWRFDILGELIRSSQMQLRMMAVTTMCADLVAIWKRLSSLDHDGLGLLRYVGGYLLRSQLIDYILSPSCHPEIIVESANIVGFLVMTHMYTAEHTERLWQGIISSKDPRVADALTRMVTNITTLFDYSGCVGLCEQLQKLPIEAFTPAVRSLWEHLFKQMLQEYSKVRPTLTFHPYNLCLRLLRESSICGGSSQIAYPEVHSFAMQKFSILLNHGPDAPGLHDLYLSCIADIAAKSPTTLGSLWCLSMAIRPALVAELQVLTEQHDLARLLVEELEHAIKAGHAAGVPAVLYGSTNQPRRDLVANLILLQSATLENELGLRLWNMLVGPQSSCSEDRIAGWQIILDVAKQTALQNLYVKTCLSQFLPALHPTWFSDGMLDLIKEEVLPLVEQTDELILDDPDMLSQTGIERLWRVILTANEGDLVSRAIHTLAVEIYLDSASVRHFSPHRIRQVHLSLVNRCLDQLKQAARRLRASSVGISSSDDEQMVVVTTEEQIEEQERVFIRSLQLLRYFLEAHQTKPDFATPDLRSLMSDAPHQIEGDLAQLKYQSFDGCHQTDVKPLNIGRLNTAASLLASLRQETGFENYLAFYRGRPFLPTEQEICQSLEDLHVHDGLILVKREADGTLPAVRIKPGSSLLEIEILTHFDELWACLSMEENLAQEIYSFLIRLPAHGSIMELFESDEASFRDVFPRGETYKCLYAIHALREYITAARQGEVGDKEHLRSRNFTTSSFEDALKKSLCFVVQAISDESMFEETSSAASRMHLISSLMQVFLQLLQAEKVASDFASPPHTRLIQILSEAIRNPQDIGLSLISNSIAAIFRLGLLHDDFWKAISADEALRNVILELLLLDDRKTVRVPTANVIEDTIDSEYQRGSNYSDERSSSEPIAAYPIAAYLWNIVRAVLPQAVKFPRKCQELFRIFHFLLVRIENKMPSLLDLEQLLQQTSNLLLEHTSTEAIDNEQPYDFIAEGLTSLCFLCLQMDDSLSSRKSLPADLAQRLFMKHLFPQQRSHSGQPVPQVILNTNTRAKLCEFIFRLIRKDSRKLKDMLYSLNSLVPFYTQDDADSPYHYDLPYTFDRSKAMRSASGYVGLRNLSNTCYLNSLLTQLYMNVEFRRFILDASLRDPLESQQLLFFTQKLFAYMQGSYARFIDPTDLVACVKTYDDAPIDIHNQMDVDEFYSLLFDRWEGQLQTSDERKKLRSFYGGQLVQQVKSKECEHISERLEPFSAIQCDIKGKSTLQDSLQAYVDGEIMEGENKYKCSTCDRHVDAVKRACLKDIPDSLIFHLKRFDFNLRTLQRSKINDYFSFPQTIDMQSYTIDHLSGTSPHDKADIFELVGILVHSGTAESGHYYSYIRERPTSGETPTWVEYNDDTVSPWDPSQMETSTFGGSDSRSVYDANGIVYDKSYSAYMLFYQRASSLRSEEEALSTANASAPLHVEVDPMMKEAIDTENTMILRRHCLFDPSHTAFVHQCFEQASILKDGEASMPDVTEDDGSQFYSAASHDLETLGMRMALGHLDQIVSRAKDLPQFDSFAAMLTSAVSRCCHCAFVLYDYFQKRHAAFRALLQRNPEPRVRSFAGQILLSALEKTEADLPHEYETGYSVLTASNTTREIDAPGGTVSVPEGTIGIFNYLWRFFHTSIRSWDEYFGTMLGFAKLGSREAAQLLAEDYLIKTLRIVAADPIMELPANYVRMLHNVLRRLSTRAPSYAAVIALIDQLLQQLEPTLGPTSIVDMSTERLDYPGPTFPWTSDEIMFIMGHPEQLDISFFLEKLLTIDQAPHNTRSIVGRLVKSSPEMDAKVHKTLKKNIRGATSTQPMDPFLRAAATYLECTGVEDSIAQGLVLYVCSQAKHLQNTEGFVFLDFIRTALQLKHEDAAFAESMHDFTLETLPNWVPHLVVYGDDEVRLETEELLSTELFRFPPSASSEADGDSLRGQMVNGCAQRLGIACLAHLLEVHVNRKVQLSRDVAASILRVINKCGLYFDAETDVIDETRIEFEALHSEVMTGLRRLIVDEVDDDGSGWEGSYASSEPTEDFAELTMQAVKEMNGMDTS